MCTGKTDCPCLQHVVERDLSSGTKVPLVLPRRQVIRQQIRRQMEANELKRLDRVRLIRERILVLKAKAKGEG